MRIKQVQVQNILSLHNLSVVVVVQLHQLRLSRFLITEGFLGRGLQLDGGGLAAARATAQTASLMRGQ